MYKGNQYTMELTNVPAFDSATQIYFTWGGQRQDLTITALGTPTPAISLAPGSSLPPGVGFAGSESMGDRKATFSFRGFDSGTAGTCPVTLEAQNANGTTKQTFQITIAQQLQITSPAFLTVPYGQPVSFLVTTTGYPPPALSIDPDLLGSLSGVDFPRQWQRHRHYQRLDYQRNRHHHQRRVRKSEWQNHLQRHYRDKRAGNCHPAIRSGCPLPTRSATGGLEGHIYRRNSQLFQNHHYRRDHADRVRRRFCRPFLVELPR